VSRISDCPCLHHRLLTLYGRAGGRFGAAVTRGAGAPEPLSIYVATRHAYAERERERERDRERERVVYRYALSNRYTKS
jgi:hypothetical protein